MKRHFLSTLLAFACLVPSAQAQVSAQNPFNFDDYVTKHVCDVTLLTSASNYGASGALELVVSNTAACVLRDAPVYFCTQDATSGQCAADDRYTYLATGLHALYSALLQSTGRRIFLERGACNGGGSGCAEFFRLLPN